MIRVGRIIRLAMLGAATVLPWLPAANAVERAAPRAAAAGATVESVIALARRLSPELVAAAFDAKASRHAVGAAGALADPTVTFEAWDVNARQGIGQRRVAIEQEFKLWGRQGLERGVAHAEAEMATHKARATAADLIARIKTVHAEYNAANEAIGLSLQLKRRVTELQALLEARYGPTAVNQQDVIRGRIEVATADVDIVRRQGELNAAAVCLNALIGRPALAVFATPFGFGRIKPGITIATIQSKARALNPALAASTGEVGAASGAKALTDLNYYPNLTLGARYVQRPSSGDSGEFLVGFKLPVQFAAKNVEQRAASSRLGAAHARNDAARPRLDGEVAETWFGLEATRKAIKIHETRQLPQARQSVETARSGFQAGSKDLSIVFEAERRLRTVHLDLLKLKIEEQIKHAELERLAGGSL